MPARRRLGPGHIAVAQAVDADAAGEVEVLLPLGAFGIEAVALLEDDGVACVGMQDILVIPLDDFFGIHNIYLLRWSRILSLFAKGSPTRGGLGISESVLIHIIGHSGASRNPYS